MYGPSLKISILIKEAAAMKIAELFGKGKTVFSCEVFPPKKDSPVDTIYQTLDGLKDIKPDFISVTFGAGGSQVNQSTREIAAIIQKQYHIPAGPARSLRRLPSGHRAARSPPPWWR